MSNLFKQASRLALVAALSTTPVWVAAQTATPKAAEEGATTEAPADSAATETPTEEGATDTTTTEAPAEEGATDTMTTEAPTEEEATDTMTTEAPPEEEATDTVTTEAPVTDDNPVAEAPAEETAKPVEGQIVMQGENTILAEDLLGSNIYSQEGEKIGKIDDLIVNLDGSVEGAVISVGGFLGIGDKWVAVEMASLSTMQDDLGNVRLVTSATKVDLEAAEPFVTSEDMAAAERSIENMPTGDGATVPTDGATTVPSN